MKIDEIKAGDLLVADGGFTCIREGVTVAVFEDGNGKFVHCADGHHYLNDRGECVGFTRAPDPFDTLPAISKSDGLRTRSGRPTPNGR